MMNVMRGREVAFFYTNYRIRALWFLYGALLSVYVLLKVFSHEKQSSKLAQPLSGQGKVKIYAVTCGTVHRTISIGVKKDSNIHTVMDYWNLFL